MKSNNKSNILLVDDSKVNLIMGSKILKSFGHNVFTAKNGQEAIDLCKKTKFDLIFMDLEMPEMGGLAASTLIRDEQLSYAPIYALTGHENEETRELCRTARMNGYIKKPLKIDKIQEVLQVLGIDFKAV